VGVSNAAHFLKTVAQEMNEGDVTTRFLQIWLTPDQRGVKPQYGSKTFQPEDRRNRSAVHRLAIACPRFACLYSSTENGLLCRPCN